MKINIEIPDWCDDRHIYVMAGVELAAYNLYGERRWHIKTERCNECGQCCSEPRPNKPFPFMLDADGNCVHLERSSKGDHGVCGLGLKRPFLCCTSLEQKGRKGTHPSCVIEYQVIE